MSIKDRNARVENRRFIAGNDPQTVERAMGANAVRGVPAESVAGGVPGPVPQNATKGVAFPMPGMGDSPPRKPAPRKCAATTKKGEACKAHPVSGEELCIGHSRI